MRKFLLSLILCSAAFGLMAQQRTIRGTVSDKDGGLPDASVVVKTTSKGVMSDLDGKYEIVVSEGETLVFSSSGAKPEERKITNKTPETLNVFLKENTQEIDEFVVVGYGKMKKSDLTGAVGSITEDKLKESVATSIDQAMQGRVAGVAVTSSTGQPGAGTSVRIRGASSLGGNEPLYVIDGMPVGQGRQGGGFNPLASINPADIVSMEVLKDASATAIYGARAAFGVVLITTRKGKAGESRISYEGGLLIGQVSKKLDMMDLKDYSARVIDPEVAKAYHYQAEHADPYLKVDPKFLGKGSDWQDAMFRTAFGHSHILSVTGGSQETIYAMSLGYQDQSGTMIGTDFQRFNGRINLENQTKKWLRTGLNLAYTHIMQTKQLGYDAINTGDAVDHENVDDTPLIDVFRKSPGDAIYNVDGTFLETQADDISKPRRNPISEALRSPTYSKSNNVMGQVFVDAEIIKDLHWRNEFGVDYTAVEDTRFHPSTVNKPTNYLKGNNRFNNYWRFASTLSYNKMIIPKHTVNAMVAFESSESSWNGDNKTSVDLPFEPENNKYHAWSLGTSQIGAIGGYKGSSATMSYLGRLNYNYDERYLLTATGRYDGSSNFAPENRWGFFPSFSAAWRINNEHFISESDRMREVISNLKLRAGYGETGNAGWGINYLTVLKGKATYEGKDAGAIMSFWPNEDLRWETNWQFNGAIDLGLFKDRISLTVDAFYKQNDNLIVTGNPGQSVADDSYLFITPPTINLGSIRNTGFEITLNTRNVETKFGGRDFSWDTDFTFSKVKNKVVKLQDPFQKNQYWATADHLVSVTREGYAPGLFWGYKVDGLIQNTDQLNEIDRQTTFGGTDVGDLNYVDRDGDGKITSDDKTFIGDPNPDFTGGFGNTFSYGPWSLTVFLTFSYGNDVYNMLRTTTEGQETYFNNQLRSVKNYARIGEIKDEEGNVTSKYIINSGTNIPRPNSNGRTLNLNETNSHFVEDGSYLRIQNIALAYRFPKRWMEKLSINDLKLSANIQNVYTFSSYSGYNPEVANHDVLKQGIDVGGYPLPRLYTFNLSFNF